MNIAGDCLGIHLEAEAGRRLARNQARIYPVRAFSGATAVPTRASLPQLKCKFADRNGRGLSLPQELRSAANWHFNCLVRIGRWWPGTSVGDPQASSPPFALSKSREAQ